VSKRIGSPYWAKRALQHDLQNSPGWKMVGSGMWRRVYKRVTGNVVYKVANNSDSDKRGLSAWANHNEYANAKALAAQGFSWVPPVTLYHFGERTVLAMPYYPEQFPSPYNIDRQTSGEKRARAELDEIRKYIMDVNQKNMRRDENGVSMLVVLGADRENDF
jgi:hypothetical protein